jgi:hypothetical protein
VSAEAIARVVADLRHQRARWVLSPHGLAHKRAGGGKTRVDPKHFADWRRYVINTAGLDGPVIDATGIYHSITDTPQYIDLYEDHPCIAPPWPNGTVAYENEHGNVCAANFIVIEDPQELGRITGSMTEGSGTVADYRTFIADLDANRDHTQPGAWATPNPVRWDDVKWLIDGFLWIGGRSTVHHRALPTLGPIYHWKIAVYGDGQPADMHWVQFHDDKTGFTADGVENGHLTLLGALNFLNCRNVDLVEPHRPNAERKRIARTGVTVSELTVFPVGRSTRTSKPGDPAGTPLTSVRGHFATYGPEHGRGLLFGKYSGRFWRPQHARGDRAHGEVAAQKFTLQPESESP